MKLPHPQALRCFVAVAQERTISGAAERLHLSQPAVSLQIKHLESATGMPLFERTAQGFAITKAGIALLDEAQAALAALRKFTQTATSLQTPAQTTLRVGTILDSEFIRLGALLSEFVGKSPGIVIQLHHGISDDVLAQMTRGELDVCFYLDSPANPAPVGSATQDAAGKHAKYVVRPLKEFVYRVVAPEKWRSRVKNKGWRALTSLPWLATPPASANGRLLASVFGSLGVQPEYTALADYEGATLDLVESGVGLCLMRDEVVRREMKRRRLVIADRVEVPCVMSFLCLEARASEFPIARALAAIDKAWAT